MSALDRPTLGIYLRILSGLLGTGMFICVKAVSDTVPLGEIVFFRSLFAVIPLLVFLWIRDEFPGGLATKRPFDHVLRAGFGALALLTSFAALARLNVAEAILIAQLTPMLTAIAAVWLLSERLTIFRIAGIGLGFAGVVVLIWPELGVGEGGTPD
ncbi:MAG: DMT family transporter [Aliishimia sp.]